ncbi:MAG: hypothetical protein ACYC49_12700 [Ignavibacteriaceae bacterium]
MYCVISKELACRQAGHRVPAPFAGRYPMFIAGIELVHGISSVFGGSSK